jgi:hypothetical protein
MERVRETEVSAALLATIRFGWWRGKAASLAEQIEHVDGWRMSRLAYVRYACKAVLDPKWLPGSHDLLCFSEKEAAMELQGWLKLLKEVGND